MYKKMRLVKKGINTKRSQCHILSFPSLTVRKIYTYRGKRELLNPAPG
jgi:hypothetical protein